MTRLEQLRVDRLMTPEQLGGLAGVSPTTIRNLEGGKGAHIGTLGKLAGALDVAPSQLLLPVQPNVDAAA